MSLIDILLNSLKRMAPVARKIFLPSDRIDEAYDPTPFATGKDYVRLWLSDAQYRSREVENGTGHLFFSRVQFLYGDKRVTIPAFIGTATLRPSSPANTPTVRAAINRPLSPLFPYCGGELQMLGGLVRTERDEIGCNLMMESLAAALTSHGFGRLLEISDILWDAIGSRIREHAQLDLMFRQRK